MIPARRLPTHPGEILLEEFLRPLGVTQVEFARRIGIPVQRVNEIVQGKRGITPETAWLFAQAFGTSPEFWLNLQSARDLARCRPSSRTRTAFLRLWYLRCLLRGSGERPAPTIRLVDGLYVIELGDMTASFTADPEGCQQATDFIAEASAALT